MEEPSAVVVVVVVVVAVVVVIVLSIPEVVVSCRRGRSSRGPPRGGFNNSAQVL